jgi:hypothetical protein
VTIPLKIRTLRCWISCNLDEISFQGGADSSNYHAFIRPFYRFYICASQPICSIIPNASISPNIPSCALHDCSSAVCILGNSPGVSRFSSSPRHLKAQRATQQPRFSDSRKNSPQGHDVIRIKQSVFIERKYLTSLIGHKVFPLSLEGVLFAKVFNFKCVGICWFSTCNSSRGG